MTRPNILVTCPPMLGLIDEFANDFAEAGLDFTPAKVTQILSVQELCDLLPAYDGWIIGDDPANAKVVAAGAAGNLRAAVKWGVGIDNVDFDVFAAHKIPVENTPNVFGEEVADVALTYVLGLARETYLIDREIRANNAWPKPSGISVHGRTVALVGFGDIGKATARRLAACGANIVVYDPYYQPSPGLDVEHAEWPQRIGETDFIVFTCPLTDSTRAMFNHELLGSLKSGVRVVNVARGPVIVEEALIEGLQQEIIHSAALDVFEVEPLPEQSPLRGFDRCIFGSHNGSNSSDAVRRVSRIAIAKIARFLGE
ncbi:NAD(P)-dependent oxidoreductase [uncultured Erythrobacter sp.]|uniref:NAD(P)-dependent oxidoreductase n=1 Tax=uncultured Erythrobacter sp. TaxID=263913 RepID=UPI00261270F0|nr:NAD(P)-dependent oxidoreductase [uncultured Erythrobacter sp.]